jgi:hypothetical protein
LQVNVAGTVLTATEHKLADLLTDSGAATAVPELNETSPKSWLTNPVKFDDAMEQAEVSSGCDAMTVADIQQPI